MIEGAIFDMDGLMFDTEPIWTRTWAPVLATIGIEYPEGLADAVRGTSGKSMEAVINRFAPEADAAYAAAEDAEVLLFADGYSGGGKPTQIRDLQLIAKPRLDELPKLCKKLKIQDLYITATDYSWTYVQTHEGYLGPYFCRRPLFDWEKEPANGQA